ncbi:MAG: hypothetical protein GYA24_09910 [Candidatus Lokiarchaeota archaeon]|nr:hypothetical protein [Candidatus Lokiarchaeota archaeon]
MLAEPVIDVRRVKIECPACGKEQYVKLRVDSLVAKNGIVSLMIKAACDHEFNLYLDSQFHVRGYERIDAVVSAEMLQVDQEISDFLKDEGMQERASGKFVGKLRNDIDRDRHLEVLIRFFRGADVTGSYWIPAISGRRPELPKLEPAKAFPLPPLPSFPAPPTQPTTSAAPFPALAANTLPPGPPKTAMQVSPHGVDRAPATIASHPAPAAEPPSTLPVPAPLAKAKHGLKTLPTPATRVPPSQVPAPAEPSPPTIPAGSPVEAPVDVLVKNPAPVDASTRVLEEVPAPVEGQVIIEKPEIETEPANESEAVVIAEVHAGTGTIETLQGHDHAASTSQPSAPEVPEITLEDLRSQFEARVKKINDLMIKLELDNLNESVSDVALVKKKAKLSKLKDDLEAQYNRIVSERGLDKGTSLTAAKGIA